MSCSSATTSSRSESTSGRAIEFGTGVTRPTQWLDRLGVSTGTGHDQAPPQARRPGAYRCIISR